MTSRKKKSNRSTPPRETVPRETAPRRVRRSVSVPLLLGTAIVLAVAAVGSYAWRSYQVSRLAPELLKQAQLLEEQGRMLEATQRIYQYLQINPDDTEATITLAETYDAAAEDLSRKQRAIELYAEAVREASAEDKLRLRKRLAELLLEVGLFEARVIDTEVVERRDEVAARLTTAGLEALEVLAEEPDDPNAARILAWSLLARHELDSLPELPSGVESVGAAVQRAVDRNPTDIELTVGLARIYRSQPELLDPSVQQQDDAARARLADEMIDRMVAAAAETPEVYLNRSAYRQTYQLPGDEQDLQTALELAPDNLGVRLANGATAQARAAQRFATGDLLAARDLRQLAVEHYEAALASHPDDVRPYVLLSQLYRELGDSDRAVEVVEQGLQRLDPEGLQLNGLMVEALLGQQDLDQAGLQRVAKHLDAYQRALTRFLQAQAQLLGPTARRNLENAAKSRQARLLARQEKFDDAVTLLNELLLDPTALTLPDRIATVRLLELCRCSQARGQEKAAADAPNEDVASVHRRRSQQRWEEAAAAAEQWSEWEPDAVQPKLQAAINYLEAGRPDRAVVRLNAVLRSQDTVAFRLLAAAAELEVQQGRTPDQQDWTEFLEHFQRAQDSHAKQPIPEAWRLVLLQAAYEQATGTDQAKQQALQRLRDAELDYPDDVACLQALAAFFYRNDAERDAQRVMTKLNVLDALQQQDWAAAEKWEQQLETQRNNPPAFWQYYRARRLLAQASGADDPRLDEASQLQADLTDEYPRAKTVAILNALLHDARGDVADAIAAYQDALAAGVRNTNVLERLILLLVGTGRFDEAQRALADAAEQMPETSTLRGLRTLIQRSKGDLDGALEVAEQDVADNPRDPLARLRLGRLYDEQDQHAQAEKAYQEAVILDPRDIRGMSALFDLYTKTERQPEAERLLEELAADPRLNQSQRVLMLATGKGLLGKVDEAEKLLRDAIAKDATDPNLRLALAESLRSRQQPESLTEAERVLRGTVQQFPESAEAKRRLANLLIEQGGEANEQQARQLLEELALGDAAGSGDAFMLARSYDRAGQWQQAGETLQRAAAARDATPEQLAAHIERMLSENTPEKAQAQITRLEALAPHHPGTIRLKVRWLLASQRAPEIPPIIENYERHLQRNLTGENSAAAIHAVIGELYLLAGDLAQAEARFRQLYDADPSAFQPLLAALARQQRLDEAIQLCAEVAATDTSTEPAIALAATLTAAKPTPQQFEQAETLFTAALAPQSDDPDSDDPDPRLLETLATFHLVHHQTDQAIALYRQLLEIQPKNHSALNNLAVALSESEETRAEALTKIDAAIKVIGKRPTYLDTKATLLLLDGRNEEAAELLEQAVSGPERRPVHQLHLAVAYARSGQDDQARKTLAIALAAGLNDDILTASDLAMLEELKQKWGAGEGE